MARKSLRDLSGIAKTIAQSGQTASDKTPRNNAPALGALQGSLTAIREIDPALIDDWGPQDRLNATKDDSAADDPDGFETLKASIAEGGQHVPILVRRSSTQGRYEVIYGRRRLQACRALGIKVRANLQDLDDADALLAKGLENAARRNLSFYEKARFAAVIQAAGHDAKTARQVLNLSASGLSHLTKVTENIPDHVGDAIGAAPKSGRPKWTSLAEAFLGGKVTAASATAILTKMDPQMTSDERLDGLLKEISRRGTRPRQGREVTPVAGVTIKSSRGAVTLSAKRNGEDTGFADWLDTHLEDIIKDAYRSFTAVNPTDEH